MSNTGSVPFIPVARAREAGSRSKTARPDSHLTWTETQIADLPRATIDAMWVLFFGYYADISRGRFEADLAEKESVILLWDRAGKLGGFSTLMHVVASVEGETFGAVFSGDTIVHRDHWGQTALHRAFFWHIVRRKIAHPMRPLYWFLISKGYKTYLLLARNFATYFPRANVPTPAREVARIDTLARLKYSSAWQPELGILRFDEPLGRLRDNVAPVGERELSDADIRYFVERNPGHADGDELVCVGRVDASLCTRFLKKLTQRRR